VGGRVSAGGADDVDFGHGDFGVGGGLLGGLLGGRGQGEEGAGEGDEGAGGAGDAGHAGAFPMWLGRRAVAIGLEHCGIFRNETRIHRECESLSSGELAGCEVCFFAPEREGGGGGGTFSENPFLSC